MMIGSKNKHRGACQYIWQLMVVSLFITFTHAMMPAQAAGVSSSYLTPFPSGGTYKVLVIGDGYAEGVWSGLLKAAAGNKKIKLYKEISYSAALLPRKRRDWLKNLDQILSVNKYDIAVIMVGYRDRRKVKIGGKFRTIDTQQWGSHYRKRIRQALKKFASRKIAVYWVGQPIVRQERLRKEMDIINQMAKIQTSSAEVRFIDHWLHFANDQGLFTPYGPDVRGKIRLLRPRDGVFFTRAGYEKLGHFIYKFIQRDMRDAKSDRNVSLLGGVADQNYLLRRHAIENPRNRKGKGETVQGKQADKAYKKRLNQLSGGRNLYETPQHSTIMIRDQNNPIGGKVRLKIVRPAIPAIAFTITKRSTTIQAQDKEDPALMVEKGQQMMGLAIASSLPQFNSDNSQRRMPLTQTQYYKLVVRGDAQESRQGRADYFVWQRKKTASEETAKTKEKQPEQENN